MMRAGRFGIWVFLTLATVAPGAGRPLLRGQGSSDYQEASYGLDGLLEDPVANYDELTRRQGILENVLGANFDANFKNRVAEDLARIQMARGAFREAVQTLMKALESASDAGWKDALANRLWSAASRSGDAGLVRSAGSTIVTRVPKSACAVKLQKGVPFLDAIGKPPKKLVATDLKGIPVDLAALKGKFVWVYFWEAGSDACSQDFPNVVGLRREREQDTDFVILTVAKGGTIERVNEFLTPQSAEGITVVHDVKGDLSRSWAVKTTPVSFIIDETGKVRFADVSDAGVRDLLKDYALRKKLAGK
ncbi:MAG: redoxin family protein [Planctomycetes bacterium]|nr:redoxin family protein [Planctomycetota bacterium]